jgi:mRNA interferase MazF
VTSRGLAVGDVVLAQFPEHLPPGHEQQGLRPAIVVGLPDRLGLPRFPIVALVPLTTDRGEAWSTHNPALYPRLAARTGGLRVDSLALLDQVGERMALSGGGK